MQLPAGNEDTTDVTGLDTDENGPNTVTNVIVGTFSSSLSSFTGNDGPVGLFLPAGPGRYAVLKTDGGNLTSQGANVLFALSGGMLIGYVDVGAAGYVDGIDRQVFTVELNQPADGQYRFTLLDNLDHHVAATAEDGEQEMSVWNGHYACACYHPLFVFNQFGDLERCALRPGNVHSADGWDGVLKPVVARYQGKVSRIYFRADAAFAMPEVYEFLEAERIKYAIRLPANQILQHRIGYLLKRPVGRPSNEVRRFHANFTYQAGSWTKPRRVIAKVEWHPGELYPRVGFIVTNLSRPADRVVAFYNKRGTCEQWIKEGKGAIKWTRLSCRTFAANAVRLQLHALAYNLGNFLRTLATPEPIKDWSLTSLKEKLIKIGAKVVSHGRYVVFQMAEVAIPRQMFQEILRLIAELRPQPPPAPA